MLHHSVGQQHPCVDTPVVPSRVSLGTTVLPRDVSLVPALLGKHGLCNQPPDCLSSAFWMPRAKATTPRQKPAFLKSGRKVHLLRLWESARSGRARKAFIESENKPPPGNHLNDFPFIREEK